jgi:arylsulfatase A-like enzyme
MKAIMLMFDSLNRHKLPPYGCTDIHAPNFQRLAQRCITFENSYVGSMPCMPARREIHTGRLNFLHRSWSPLEPFDDSMPEILSKNGIYSHLITDHYHYFENGGATYHTRYDTWEFVRGQEGDPWKASIAEPEIPKYIGGRANRLFRQDWVNRPYMQGEENHPQKLSFDLGLEFIDKNRESDKWFLQLEVFDPHEPFFAPDSHRKLYPDNYTGPHFDWPNYKQVTETPEEIDHVKNEYRALVSFCDHNLGRLLDKMDSLGLWEDTLFIVNTDHGFLLGEHDWWAKCVMPFYNEVARTPLFIYDPRYPQSAGQRRNSLVQTIDLAPTILDFFGQEIPADMQGKSLDKVISGDSQVHEAVLFGIHGGHVNCTDGRYVYMRASAGPENAPLYNYTLMPMHMRERFTKKELEKAELCKPFSFTKGCPVLKIPSGGIPELKFASFNYGTLLFDLTNDPGQENPIQDAAIEKRMTDLMIRLMEENEAPAEQYTRLGLK